MIKIVVFIYILMTAGIFGVDFFYYMLDRYGRYHIGQFKNENEWKQKAINKAKKWVKREPTVKVSDNNRYLLIDMLTGKYRNRTIQSWQKGALYLGLMDVDNALVQSSIKTIIKDGEWICKPTNIDCGLLAYAILKNCDPIKVKPAMDYVVKLIRMHVAEDGMIVYTNDMNSRERYVDTLGLAVPFLFLYAKVYQSKEERNIAFFQIKEFSKYGLEEKSKLPNHAYDSDTKLPLGNYGWGRGCGWYALGLIDSYREMESGEEKKWVKNHIQDIANSYMKFQRTDGGFGRILQLRTGYDSSVTAVLAYFYSCCYELFSDDSYKNVYEKCIEKLRTVTKITGALDWCQGDTKDIGVLSQTFSIMPFAQGMMIRSFRKD